MLGLHLLNMGKQPGLKRFGSRIVFDNAFEDFALERKPYGIGPLIAFAAPSAPFRRFERREQRSADIGGAKLLQ
jgi:hypothetical protein